MLLAVDIGNTNIVLGTFKGDRLTGKQRVETSEDACIRVRGKVDAAMIASVVPQMTASIASSIRKSFGIRPIIVDWRAIKGLKIAVKDKSQIGIDRLVNAAAAIERFGCPLLIIDLGTATTFDAIDSRGRYLGGAITSGLAISRDVLHERTAKLPLVEIRKPSGVIGGNTKEAIRSGLYFGYIDMIDGMIKRFRAKLGRRMKVVATGGLSGMIASGTKNIDAVDMDLTLKGLNKIYKSMRGKK